jgi:hypothetical protein
MVKRLAVITLVILAATILAYPAYASLVPMSWGFPVFIQNNSLTGLQTATQSATDNEASNIDFGLGSGLGGLFGSAFPNIGQTSLQNAFGSNLAFQSAHESTIFAYPFLSIGGSPIPGMGLL